MYELAKAQPKYGIMYSTAPHLKADFVFYGTEEERNAAINHIKETGTLKNDWTYEEEYIEVHYFSTLNASDTHRKVKKCNFS